MTIREAKIILLEEKLSRWLNDAPLREDGLFGNYLHMATKIVDDLEAEEVRQLEKLSIKNAETHVGEVYGD